MTDKRKQMIALLGIMSACGLLAPLPPKLPEEQEEATEKPEELKDGTMSDWTDQ